jgi:hypothetical protein
MVSTGRRHPHRVGKMRRATTSIECPLRGVVGMRRIVFASVFVVAIGLIPSPAHAQQVLHMTSSLSGQFDVPAGTFCDFNLREVFAIYDNSVIFGDPDDPDKVITYEEQDVTHINLDTGYTLTEVDHIVFVFTAADAHLEQFALFWHLRNSDGKIVVVQAGIITLNTDTGEVIRFTPGINPDSAAVLCPALGGSPA